MIFDNQSATRSATPSRLWEGLQPRCFFVFQRFDGFSGARDFEVIGGGLRATDDLVPDMDPCRAAGCIDLFGQSKSGYRLPLCSLVAVSFLWERREPRCFRLLQASGSKLGAMKKR